MRISDWSSDVCSSDLVLTGVIGPNGAGKTTLLKALMCLLGADRGRVLIDGRPAAQMTAGERDRLLSYLPQGQDVHWPLSVEVLVGLGRLPHLAPFSRPVGRATCGERGSQYV